MADPELIDQFVSITDASPQIARHILEAHGWDLESSVNFYLESGGVGHGTDTPGFGPRAQQQKNPSGPQPAQAAPRSSPLRDLPLEDDDNLADDRALAASLGRRRPVHDYFSDDDWEPGDQAPHSEDEMEIDDSEPEEVEILDSDEEGAGRRNRVRRNRPSGAAAVDPNLAQLGRSFGSLAAGPASHPAAGQGEDDVAEDVQGVQEDIPLPDDVDLEEQRMLLAALTGEEYRGRIPDFSTDPRYRPVQLSPGARAREQLRQEQDAAYHESLAADRKKAEEAERAEREAQEAEDRARREKERIEREQEEAAAALERTLTSKEATLPEEPADAQDAVQIVVRMPSGGRFSRRFRQTDNLSSVFDFVDVSGRASELQPGSYNLVSQFPRRVFEDGGQGTLNDANLSHKQEALFIEMK